MQYRQNFRVFSGFRPLFPLFPISRAPATKMTNQQQHSLILRGSGPGCIKILKIKGDFLQLLSTFRSMFSKRYVFSGVPLKYIFPRFILISRRKNTSEHREWLQKISRNLQAGVHLNVVFPPLNMGLKEISCSRFRQSRNSMFISQFYDKWCFVIFWGIFERSQFFSKKW